MTRGRLTALSIGGVRVGNVEVWSFDSRPSIDSSAPFSLGAVCRYEITMTLPAQDWSPLLRMLAERTGPQRGSIVFADGRVVYVRSSDGGALMCLSDNYAEFGFDFDYDVPREGERL